MSRHTPGPWREASWKADRIIEALADPENSATYYAPICELEDGWSEEIGDANARLIAAAPELLKALKLLAHDVDGYGLAHPEGGRFECEHLDLALAAIAKATGEDND